MTSQPQPILNNKNEVQVKLLRKSNSANKELKNNYRY